MRPIRTGPPTPQPEEWSWQEIMNHLKCSEMKANEIFKTVCKLHNVQGNYNTVPKEWVIDYLNEKDRIQREREARYNADIATTKQIAVLEEQVKTLKEMYASSSKDARKAWLISVAAVIIAFFTLLIELLNLI